MKIESVCLPEYKRFVDLKITDIPESARLVVLVGPNGSGKSSLFDAFLLKSWSFRSNPGIRGNSSFEGYYNRNPDNYPRSARQVADRIEIKFHSRRALTQEEWSAVFNIRSAYRNESDFRLDAIQAVGSAHTTDRFTRIIDADQAVSDNYKRLAWRRQADIDRDAPVGMTIGQYRREFLMELQAAMGELFTDPSLRLQDFGGIEDAGAFRFTKGTAEDFHYKNLSGEKRRRSTCYSIYS